MQFPSPKYRMWNNTNNILRKLGEANIISAKKEKKSQMLALNSQYFHNTAAQIQPQRFLLTFCSHYAFFLFNFKLTHPPTRSYQNTSEMA